MGYSSNCNTPESIRPTVTNAGDSHGSSLVKLHLNHCDSKGMLQSCGRLSYTAAAE